MAGSGRGECHGEFLIQKHLFMHFQPSSSISEIEATLGLGDNNMSRKLQLDADGFFLSG